MTKITLSEQENSLLEKGLKHNINTMVSQKTIKGIIQENKTSIQNNETTTEEKTYRKLKIILK